MTFYSIAETVEVSYIYYAEQCAHGTTGIFNQRHSEKHMDLKCVRELVQTNLKNWISSEEKNGANGIVDEH